MFHMQFFFPTYQSIEINLKAYTNNNILVKNEHGKILETNEAGYKKIKTGNSSYGALIVEEGSKITVENIYFSGFETDFINTIVVEITNNKGKVDVIKCDFEFGESKYYKFNYDCNSGEIKDISFTKTWIMFIEEYWKLLLFILVTIIFISIAIIKIIKKKYT